MPRRYIFRLTPHAVSTQNLTSTLFGSSIRQWCFFSLSSSLTLGYLDSSRRACVSSEGKKEKGGKKVRGNLIAQFQSGNATGRSLTQFVFGCICRWNLVKRTRMQMQSRDDARLRNGRRSVMGGWIRVICTSRRPRFFSFVYPRDAVSSFLPPNWISRRDARARARTAWRFYPLNFRSRANVPAYVHRSCTWQRRDVIDHIHVALYRVPNEIMYRIETHLCKSMNIQIVGDFLNQVFLFGQRKHLWRTDKRVLIRFNPGKSERGAVFSVKLQQRVKSEKFVLHTNEFSCR